MEVKGTKGRKEGAKSYTTNYDFGADMVASAKLFGDKVVYNAFIAKVVIDLQNLIRNAINAGKTPAEIEVLVKAWKPGVKVSRGKSKYEKTLAGVQDLDEEQLAAVAKRAAELLAQKKKQ